MDDGQFDPGNSANNPAPTPPAKKPPAPVSPKQKEQVLPADNAISSDEAKVHSTQEGDKVAKEEGDDYWLEYAKEIELEKEIAEMGGVEKIESGEVKLPEDITKEMGIKPTVTINTPLKQAAEFSIRGVSLTDDQLATGSTKPLSSSFRWLVEWFIYQLLKAHFVVKKAKNIITRERKK